MLQNVVFGPQFAKQWRPLRRQREVWVSSVSLCFFQYLFCFFGFYDRYVCLCLKSQLLFALYSILHSFRYWWRSATTRRQEDILFQWCCCCYYYWYIIINVIIIHPNNRIIGGCCLIDRRLLLRNYINVQSLFLVKYN